MIIYYKNKFFQIRKIYISYFINIKLLLLLLFIALECFELVRKFMCMYTTECKILLHVYIKYKPVNKNLFFCAGRPDKYYII